MAHRQLVPVSPGKRNLAMVRGRARLGIPLVTAGMVRWVRLTVSGRDQLPRRQPVLFLSNHAGFFDPPIMAIAAGKGITMLATESNFREGPIGRFLVFFGAVPKMKYTADVRAIITLKRWADAGANIGLFPEGERTWDGRRLPLVAGTDKLVRLLGLPLVTMRIYNGFRQSPRWSGRMRRGRIHVEFDPPREFSRDTPLAEIKRYIDERITVDPLGEPRFPVAGGSLAGGIANVAWACPRCFRIDGLEEAGNRLQCRGCRGRWRVDWDSRLLGRGGTATYTLPEVVDRVRAHYAVPEAAAGSPLLVSEPMTLLDIGGRQPRPVGMGRMRLTRDELLIEGELPWQVPLVKVGAITVDMRRRLTLRAGSRYLEAVLPTESVLKWEWFVRRCTTR